MTMLHETRVCFFAFLFFYCQLKRVVVVVVVDEGEEKKKRQRHSAVNVATYAVITAL